MTDYHKKVGKWSFLVAAVIGGIGILTGNALTVVSRSFDGTFWGNFLRTSGLALCVLTGVAYLITRNAGRWRKFAAGWGYGKTPVAAGSVGPSPLLVMLLRLYSVALILLAVYTVGSFAWSVLAYSAYPSGWAVWYVFVMLISALLAVPPGFLIWSLTNVIVRMGQKLEDISHKTAETSS